MSQLSQLSYFLHFVQFDCFRCLHFFRFNCFLASLSISPLKLLKRKCFLPIAFSGPDFRSITENNVFTFLSITYAVFSFFSTKNGFLRVYNFSLCFCVFESSHTDSSYISPITTFFLLLLLNYALFCSVAPKTLFRCC